MSITSKVTEGAGFLTFNNIFLQSSAIVRMLIMAATWITSDIGSFRFLLSIFTMGAAITDLGFDMVVSSEFLLLRPAGEDGKIKRLLSEYFKARLIIGLVSLVVFSAASFFFRRYIESAMIILPAAGVYVLLMGFRKMYLNLFLALKQFRLMFLHDIIEGGLLLCLFVVLVWFYELGPVVALISFPLSVAAPLVILFPVLMRKLSFLKGVEKAEGGLLKHIFIRHGKYAAFVTPFRHIFRVAPIWFIKAFLGDAAVGIFAVASAGYFMLVSIFLGLGTAIFPVAVEKMEEDLPTALRVFKKYAKYGLMLGVALIIVFYFAAPLIYNIPLWEKGKFTESIPLFRMLLITFLIHPFMTVQFPLLYGMRGQKYIFISYIIGTAISAVVYLAALHFIKLPGVLWGFIVSTLAFTLVQQHFIHRIQPGYRYRPGDFFSFDEFDRRLLKRAVARIKSKIRR